MEASTSAQVRRFPAFAGVGPTAAKLIEELAKLDVGDQRTDEQLAAVCGKRTGSGEEGYAALQTAIRHVLRHHHKVIERIRGAAAVKCLNATEVLQGVNSDLDQVRRRSRRSVGKLAVADQATLSNEERIRANALFAQHGAIAHIAKNDSTKKLEARSASTPTDVRALLEALK